MIRAVRSRSGTRPNGIVTAMVVAGIVASLTSTLVVPMISKLPPQLGTTASNASWVVTATLLAAAVTTPVMSRLGDLYGKRRMMLICSVPLVLGCVVCALASDLTTMVVGRGLQGMGMGMIPLGISALRDVLPPERLGPSIALMSSSMGIGGALGLPVAAAVAEYASWRVLFWATAALGLLVAMPIRALVPATPATPAAVRGRVDIVGALGLSAGLVCLLLGVSKGGDWGWASGTTLGLLAAAVLVLLAWGRWELRNGDPLVDLRVAARPQMLMTNIASIVVGFSMYAQALIVIQILLLPAATGYGLGQSLLAAGLWMAPAVLVMMIVSPIGARLSAARGPKVTLIVGSLIMAAGYGSSVFLLGSTGGLLILTCVCSIGIGFTYGCIPTLITSVAPPTESAAASSFNTLMRSIGATVSAAVVGLILSQMTTEFAGRVLPSEAGFRTGMLIGCGTALLAAAITLAVPGRRAGPAVPQSDMALRAGLG
ncbi:MFS transporter [Nonomuraea sp. NPDC026600]|uniref:MFS transporter n=1 Tax=Nonomuraea sp. NPDC026600 TaxID=3155363 RepID=UPI0033D7DF4F